MPDGFQEMRGNPMIVDSDDYSKNTEIAQRLWNASEDMTNVSYLKVKNINQTNSIMMKVKRPATNKASINGSTCTYLD